MKMPEQENSFGENELFSADLALFEAIYGAIHEEGYRVCLLVGGFLVYLMGTNLLSATRFNCRTTNQSIGSRC
ncbi:hypothetical protein M1146_03410 [Patescibacteria group bacterium]|nr:hypothetical protein [Patescibacteria group bacterium]